VGFTNSAKLNPLPSNPEEQARERIRTGDGHAMVPAMHPRHLQEALEAIWQAAVPGKQVAERNSALRHYLRLPENGGDMPPVLGTSFKPPRQPS
jgi:hypothetical protein